MLRRAATPLIPIRGLATAAPSTAVPGPSRRAALQDGLTFDDFVSGATEHKTVRLGKGEEYQRLPSFLKHPVPTGSSYHNIKEDLKGLNLHTVCQSAKCPNIGECWSGGKSKATATIMLMGDQCTRGCRFCSVSTSRAPPPLDPHEPENTAEAIKRWAVGTIVMTSVDRDDLADGGSAHIAETIRKVKQKAPDIIVEMLSPDFSGDVEAVRRVALSGLDVFAHNVETVERCTPFVRDRRAKYRQSLAVLEEAKRAAEAEGRLILTKSSIMLGVGEEEHEIEQTLRDLREARVDVVTFGQYMRPTKRHMKVERYVLPEEFKRWKVKADSMGFTYCAAGPLVRSSYKAGEYFMENFLRKKKASLSEVVGKTELESPRAET